VKGEGGIFRPDGAGSVCPQIVDYSMDRVLPFGSPVAGRSSGSGERRRMACDDFSEVGNLR
jgi:hypothetical protein